MNEISVCIKNALKSSLPLSPCEVTVRIRPSMKNVYLHQPIYYILCSSLKKRHHSVNLSKCTILGNNQKMNFVCNFKIM